MTDTSRLTLEERTLLEAQKKATPLPWYLRDRLTDEEASMPGGLPPEILVEVDAEDHSVMPLFDVNSDHDLAYIVAAANAVPGLLSAIAHLRKTEQAAEGLAEALMNDPHVVEFRMDGWSLRHPVTCRSDMFACIAHLYLDRQPAPLKKPGRYTLLIHKGGATFTDERPNGILPALSAYQATKEGRE